jgi:hypothetical protein
MRSKVYLLAGLLFAYSAIASASTAIGTASARGDIRVDGYAVSGNATLFDGSAVQTTDASATIRIDKGTEIKLATASMGTMFRDHMVLERGSSQLSSSDSFRLDAGGFSVMPANGKALGMVTMNGKGTVEVAALNGELNVTDPVGNVIRTVLPGKSMSFALQGGTEIALRGKLSESDGNYYVTDANGVMHQVVLKDADGHTTTKGLQKYVGKDVNIVGNVEAGATPSGGASNVIAISGITKFAGGAGLASSTLPVVVTAGGAAAFLVAGIYYASQTPTTASR